MHNQIPMQVVHTADPAGNHLCKKKKEKKEKQICVTNNARIVHVWKERMRLVEKRHLAEKKGL